MKIPDSSEFENIIITDSLSDSDSSTNYFYQKVNNSKKLSFDEWNIIYSDEIYYMYTLLLNYINDSNSPLLGNLDYSKFMFFCYENSSKYYKFVSNVT
jgi:hypothetical protein